MKKKNKSGTGFKITKDNREAFCDAVGLHKKEFVESLKKSEIDHRAGRITKRKSLREICEKA